MGKRGEDDQMWKSLVQYIRNRDKVCRLFRVLTIGEMAQLKKLAPRQQLNTFDPAHVIPASVNGTMVYEPKNIVLLNRYSHENLDLNRDPITGKRLTQNQKHQWWSRIVGTQRYKELLSQANRQHHMPDENDTSTQEEGDY